MRLQGNVRSVPDAVSVLPTHESPRAVVRAQALIQNWAGLAESVSFAGLGALGFLLLASLPSAIQ